MDVIARGFPRVIIIDYVISFEGGIYFLYENLENVNCNDHFNTHEVTTTSIISLCQPI